MSTVGGETMKRNSALYNVAFIDKNGQTVQVVTRGIARISITINVIDLFCIEGLFQIPPLNFKRPNGKEIDILFGSNMQHIIQFAMRQRDTYFS